MNIINGNPFCGNYVKAGGYGPACAGKTKSSCSSGCGCNSSCGCVKASESFTPSPQFPFSCAQGCAAQGRADWGGCESCQGNGCGEQQQCWQPQCCCEQQCQQPSQCCCEQQCWQQPHRCCEQQCCQPSQCCCEQQCCQPPQCCCEQQCCQPSHCCCGQGGDESCEEAVALLSNPCFGLPTLKAQIDDIQCAVGEIYGMMAPVPCNPCPCHCQH